MNSIKLLFTILKLKIRIIINTFIAIFRRIKKKSSEGGERKATPIKRSYGLKDLLLGFLFFIIFTDVSIFAILVFISKVHSVIEYRESKLQNINNGSKKLEQEFSDKIAKHIGKLRKGKSEELFKHIFVEPKKEIIYSGKYYEFICFLLCVLFITTMLFNVNIKDDMFVEWLITMPVSLRTIYIYKVIEGIILNRWGWMSFIPSLTVILIYWGWGWLSIVYAILATLMLNFIVAMIVFLFEFACRKLFPVYWLNTINAIAIGLGLMLFYFILMLVSVSSMSSYILSFLYDKVSKIPIMYYLFPVGAILSIFRDNVYFNSSTAVLLLFGEIIAVTSIVGMIISFISKKGIEFVQLGYKGKRTKQKQVGREILSGIIGKDIKLLVRDKVLFVETVFFPLLYCVFVILTQFEDLSIFLNSMKMFSVTLFGMGFYLLMNAGLRVLIYEKDAMWLLFTFPHRFITIVLQKTICWMSVSLFIVVVPSIVRYIWIGSLKMNDLIITIYSTIGIIISAFVASALAVLDYEPSQEKGFHGLQREKVDTVYFFMMLGAMLGGGIFLPSIEQKLSVVVLLSIYAVALWQRSYKLEKYILDPTAMPKKEFDLASGLIITIIFFFIQTIPGIILSLSGLQTSLVLSVSYAIAGVIALSIFLMEAKYYKINISKYVNLVQYNNVGVSLFFGAIIGIVLGIIGYVYLLVIYKNYGLYANKLTHNIKFDVFIIILYVILAPVFEEIIFRGIVYKGMRQWLPSIISIAISALIFAICHPYMLVIPVFIVGLVTAWIYEKMGVLLPCIIIHSVYNAIILAVNMFLL